MLNVIYSGFYVSYRNMADPLKLFYFLNPKRFAFCALLLNQFEEGSEVLDYNGLPSYEGESVLLDVMILLLSAILFNALAAVMLCRLQLHKKQTKHVVVRTEELKTTKDLDREDDGMHLPIGINGNMSEALIPKTSSSPKLFLREILPVHVSFDRMSVVKPRDEDAETIIVRADSTSQSLQGLAVDKQGSKVLLYDVSGIIEPGSIQAIMGPSGSGKTTLLSAISSNKSNDCVHWNGRRLDTTRNNCHLHRNVLGFVTQDINMMESATVRETLTFAAKLKVLGQPKAEDIQRHVDAFLGL
jgi:ABC-type glutathione transport system ATPase component